MKRAPSIRVPIALFASGVLASGVLVADVAGADEPASGVLVTDVVGADEPASGIAASDVVGAGVIGAGVVAADGGGAGIAAANIVGAGVAGAGVVAPEALAAGWLDDTVLGDCEYCRTPAFAAERRELANQSGPLHDPASGTGYIVSIERNGRFVWGRAALMGTGNLIRTDAHVLIADDGQLKAPDGSLYFEPLHHRGTDNLIEIDLTSVRHGESVGPYQTDVGHDWAVARLREDAIARFGGRSVFAFLWDLPTTHDDIHGPESARTSAFVLSHEVTFRMHHCDKVKDDHPSHYLFDAEEIVFLRCPSDYLDPGVSGSVLATLSGGNTWHLGGQLVAGASSRLVRVAGNGRAAETRMPGHQLFLGNTPPFRRAMTALYLQELRRRGIDPRRDRRSTAD